jgi:hypothetical protein
VQGTRLLLRGDEEERMKTRNVRRAQRSRYSSYLASLPVAGLNTVIAPPCLWKDVQRLHREAHKRALRREWERVIKRHLDTLLRERPGDLLGLIMPTPASNPNAHIRITGIGG